MLLAPWPVHRGCGRLQHLPSQPVPMLDNPFPEEKFPKIQRTSPLVTLEGISARPVTCHRGEGAEPHRSITLSCLFQAELPHPPHSGAPEPFPVQVRAAAPAPPPAPPVAVRVTGLWTALQLLRGSAPCSERRDSGSGRTLAPPPPLHPERRCRAIPGPEGAGWALSVVAALFCRPLASLPPRDSAHVFGSPAAPEEEAWWADIGRCGRGFPGCHVPHTGCARAAFVTPAPLSPGC